MELLRESIAARNAACERDRLAVRERLASAVKEYLPTGTRMWVYGSLNESGRFREWSDVDVALVVDPPGMSIYLLASLLAERCGRPVDVCLLGEENPGRERILIRRPLTASTGDARQTPGTESVTNRDHALVIRSRPQFPWPLWPGVLV